MDKTGIRITLGVLGVMGFILMCSECDSLAFTLGVKAAAALMWTGVWKLCDMWHEDL